MKATVSRAEYRRVREWRKKNPHDTGHQQAVLETPPSGRNHIHWVYLDRGAWLNGPGQELYGIDRERQRVAATTEGERVDLEWVD